MHQPREPAVVDRLSSLPDDVDRLSSLPDDLLSRILSLMPTKFAVRTIVLSKRWEHSWEFVSNLDFDDIHNVHGLQCLSKFVDRVLNLSKATQIKLFRLNFVEIWPSKFLVSRWIDRAVSRNACEIDVNVIFLELPLSLFRSSTLTTLRLVFSVHDNGVWRCASPVHLPRLKTLEVVVWSKPSENVLKLVRGCPVLESLSVEVMWRGDEEEYNFNVPTLKKLKLSEQNCVSTINRVVLNVPNLESLCIRGILCSHYVAEDLSSLVEATVSFWAARDDRIAIELLRGLSGVKSLSCSVRSIPDPLYSTLPKSNNLTRLELKGVHGFKLMLITQFLESTPKLEHLSLDMKLEPFSGDMVTTRLVDYLLVEPESVPCCMQTHLSTIEVYISKGGKYELQFLQYILSHAEVLKKLTVTCASLRLEEEMEVRRQLLKFSRCSRACEIRFCGSLL